MVLGAVLLGLAGADAVIALAEPPESEAVARAATAPQPERVPRGWRSPRGIGGIKAATASAAALLLAIGAGSVARGRRIHESRAYLGGLATLGILGALCWWNLFQFHYPGFAHPSETFHYYIGAKYFPELGYDNLYACTAVADAEAGLDAPRPMRDLRSNALITSAEVLAQPERCKQAFTPARWAAFRTDIDRLRSSVAPRRWLRSQQDHGYNATPAWGIAGRLLTSTGPVTEGQLRALRSIDTGLLLALGLGIVWAFGWQVAAIAAVFFGCNYVAPFGWTGGGLLRQDWLAATGLALCALRKEWFATGGALLAFATLLRLFPGLVVVGALLGILGRWVGTRRLTLMPGERRFLAGGLVATALLLPASAALHGGFGSWQDFAQNSRTHLSTPLANHLGLRSVLSHDPSLSGEQARDPALDDPMARWKQGRTERFGSQRLFFAALVLGFAGLVARAGAGQPLWLGAALGVALIPIAAELTGYYWAVLLALAVLTERFRDIGAGLCAVAALGWGVAQIWHWTDEIHVWISVVTVAFCLYVVLRVTPRPPRTRPAQS